MHSVLLSRVKRTNPLNRYTNTCCRYYAQCAALDRWMSTSTSRGNFARILDGLRAGAPDARIVVMAMNPISGLRGWMRPFLSSYIAAHREESEKRGLDYIDFGPAWQALPPDELEAAIPDGLHPKPQVAGEVMAPLLANLIAPRSCPPGK